MTILLMEDIVPEVDLDDSCGMISEVMTTALSSTCRVYSAARIEANNADAKLTHTKRVYAFFFLRV